MKKYEMLDIVAKLCTVNDKVGKGKSLHFGMTERFEECQDAAIRLGTNIEKQYMDTYEESVKSIVGLLETYCEYIYQLTLLVADQNKGRTEDNSLKKITKKIQKQLSQLKSLIQYELPDDKKEIVFLPYKASMWDSLESIWKAAELDDDCEVYVIPIPYYDKSPDGSFHRRYYEGNQFPDDVTITKYEEYDFEKRHPDVIYIHNPYDQYNIVTSVPPFFFSSNLKDLTERLVYVPYFVLKEIHPDEKEKIEGIKHFITTPAVFNAHKVVVQSENMKQVYINVLLDYTKNYSEEARKYWNQKIQGLGSPKIDKILNTEKERLNIPEEWIRVIRKKDGSKKKIVFYNTSIGALLQYNEKMLEKIRHVFSAFKECKDEIALLWRPHPLIENTLYSMRPQLWAQYEQIKNQYILDAWGIYDDSVDIDRAVMLSDVYYGDGSSVTVLFEKMNKCVMYQNVSCMKMNSLYQSIRISKNAIIDDKYIWLVSNYTNVVMKLSINTRELVKFYYYPEEYLDIFACASCIKVEHIIYFAPCNGQDLWEFDIEKEQFKKIDLGLSREEKCRKQKFTKIICYRQKLYLIGRKVHGIFCVDLLDGQVQRIDTFLKFLQDNGTSIDELFAEQYEIVNNVLYMPLQYENIIMAFHLIKHEVYLHKIEGGRTKGFNTIIYDGKKFRLTNSNDEEVFWDIDNGVQYKTKLNFIQSEKKQYQNIVKVDDLYIFFPHWEGTIGQKIGNEDMKRLVFFYPEHELFPDGFGTKFEFVVQNKDKIFFQVRSNGQCYYFDLQTKDIYIWDLDIPVLVCETIVKKLFENIMETEIYEKEVKNIINYIKYTTKCLQKKDDICDICGNKIHHLIDKE